MHRVNHRGPVIGLIRVTYFGDISAPGLNEHDLVLGDMHGMISTMKISWNNDDNDDKLVSPNRQDSRLKSNNHGKPASLDAS